MFITRQSSQPGTLALSVKLTAATAQLEAGSRLSNGAAAVIGAGVQHYLIEAAENQQGVRLESSDFVFDNLPSLLAHYCQCCDELPVRLRLPAKIRDCPTRASLTSLALLGNHHSRLQSRNVKKKGLEIERKFQRCHVVYDASGFLSNKKLVWKSACATF